MFASSRPHAAEASLRFTRAGLMADEFGAAEPEPQRRDWKKLVLITGLGALSWVATYVGMLELIESNMGDLPLVHKVIIGFSVAMLMTMIVWLLDQIFSPVGIIQRLSYVAGYLFLSIISVGFGFGFYWKVLESRAESSRSAESAVTAVQSSLNAASTRLEQLNATLAQLAAVSKEKAETERAKGTSCPNSKPGDGPRRRMREDDAARFSFASEFVTGRVTAVKADMLGLDADLAKIVSADPSIIDPKTGTRNEFMKALSRKLDMTVSSFNALRTDPQLKELKTSLQERADKTTFGDPKNGGFQCPDPQLAQALRGAVRAIGELPVLEKPTIAAVEGSEATIEAFRRLTATFYGLLSFKLPPSADELRDLQKKAMQSVEGGAPAVVASEAGGLSKRDYVPLAVAIFVDICLFLVSIGRPMHRLHGLVPKMREAERSPVAKILTRFNDIHRDDEVRETFELFRHVVFDRHGVYYVAVPLDAPPRLPPDVREDLRIETQILANLFTSFEKERIFTRVWTPFAPVVRTKLRKQGSKFAESEAFRVYRFRDGAWSEIILGAVMGAAHRAEAELQRRRSEPEPDRPEPVTTKPAGDPPRAEPRFTEQAPPRTERNTIRDRAARTEPPAARRRTGPRPVDLAAEPKLELAEVGRPESRSAAPANNNTAPAAERPPNSGQMDAARDTIDVVVRRETATLTLPLNEEALRDGLIGRIGTALTGPDAAPEKKSFDARDLPRPVLIASRSGVEAASHAPQENVSDEHVGAADESDAEIADAAAIAGRLRPLVAGE